MRRQQLIIGEVDIERFRYRAQHCRAEAEMTTQPKLRHDLLETVVAYERMAIRAQRLLRSEG